MKFLAMALLAGGRMGVFGFYEGAIKGQIKWKPDQILTGSRARLVGVVSLVLGLAMLAAGGFVALRMLGR